MITAAARFVVRGISPFPRHVVPLAVAAVCSLFAASAASPTVSPGGTSAVAETIAAGDVVVAGAGVTWLRANGVAVAPLDVGGRRIPAVAAEPAGLDAVYAAVDRQVWHYDATGQLSYLFTPDALADRVTAIDASARAHRLAVAVSALGGFHHIFVYSLASSGLRHVETEASILVADEVRDLDLAADGCGVLYATALRVGRLNVCRSFSFPDLVDEPATAVQLLPDGHALAAVGGAIRELDEAGRAVRTYRVTGVGAWSGIDLTPDATSIWASTTDGRLYRISRAEGAVFGPITVPAPVDAIAVHRAAEGVLGDVAGLAQSSDLALDGLPTLSNERLSAFIPVSDSPGTTCGTNEAIPFSTEPIGALGPYRGTFTVNGRWALTATPAPGVTLPTQLPVERAFRAASLRGRFSISSPRAAVAGTYALSRGARAVGGCRTFTNLAGFAGDDLVSGYAWFVRGAGLPYEARITRRGKTYFDRGRTAVSAARYFIRGQAGRDYGRGGRYAQSFRSDLLGVTESFASVRSSARHTVRVPRRTRSVTLTTRWASPRDAFDVVGARMVRGGRVLASVDGTNALQLRVKVRRGPRSVTVTVSNPPAGNLTFNVKPTRLEEKGTRTTATTVVRRRANRP